MAQGSLADLMGLISDLMDFLRSAHEALLEKKRKQDGSGADDPPSGEASSEDFPTISDPGLPFDGL